MRLALDAIWQSLHHSDLPVKVEAALALNSMLHHEVAVELVRPGLEQLLKTYLKIMDEIDFDELIVALQELVDTFQENIAPFAIGLC